MKLLTPALLLTTVVVLGGCTTTITPRGDIYTEAYFPPTVVVEPAPVVWVSPAHKHHLRPLGPYASRHRPHRTVGAPGPQGPSRPHGRR